MSLKNMFKNLPILERKNLKKKNTHTQFWASFWQLFLKTSMINKKFLTKFFLIHDSCREVIDNKKKTQFSTRNIFNSLNLRFFDRKFIYIKKKSKNLGLWVLIKFLILRQKVCNKNFQRIHESSSKHFFQILKITPFFTLTFLTNMFKKIYSSFPGSF